MLFSITFVEFFDSFLENTKGMTNFNAQTIINYRIKMNQFSKELQTFTITILLLNLLSEESSYGYKLVRDIEERSEGHVKVDEGYLYPMLAKMRREGLLNASWYMTPSKQRRKMYNLSMAGKNRLRALKEDYAKVATWM